MSYELLPNHRRMDGTIVYLRRLLCIQCCVLKVAVPHGSGVLLTVECCKIVFLWGHFLFTCSDIFAVRCIVWPQYTSSQTDGETGRQTDDSIISGGASAIKEPGHFEVRKSSSQVRSPTFPPSPFPSFSSLPLSFASLHFITGFPFLSLPL